MNPNPLLNGALTPDAPLAALLTLRNNPDLKTANPEELRRIVQELRVMATQAPTATARLRAESATIGGGKKRVPRGPSEAQKAQAMRD